MYLRAALSLVVLAAPLAAMAQTPAAPQAAPEQVTQQVTTTQAAPKPVNPLNVLTGQAPEGASRISGGASVGYSSNLYSPGSYDSQQLTTYSLRLDYRVQGANLIRGFISGFQEATQGQENNFNDGTLAWVNNGFWRRGEVLTVGQQVRLLAPMSKDSYRAEEKLTGVILAPVFILNLTPTGLTGVTLVYQPQLTKNFHRYEFNRSNGANTEYAFNNVVSLNYAVTDHVYWRNDFVYAQGWSYGGVKRDDRWQFASEVGYTFNSGLGLALGVSNNGAVRNLEYGTDQTVNIFNNRTAAIYTDVSYFF